MPKKPETARNDFTDLEHLLEISEDNLVQEWHDQPKLYTKFSRYAARCEAALEEAQLAVKTVFAKQFTDLRNDLTGKRKSDETIKQQIYASEEYQAVEFHRIKMLERSKVAQGLQKAADQRQYSLMHLSKRALGGTLDQFGEGMRDELKQIMDQALRRFKAA